MGLLCILGFHSGVTTEGAFRCAHCNYRDVYSSPELHPELFQDGKPLNLDRKGRPR